MSCIDSAHTVYAQRMLVASGDPHGAHTPSALASHAFRLAASCSAGKPSLLDVADELPGTSPDPAQAHASQSSSKDGRSRRRDKAGKEKENSKMCLNCQSRTYDSALTKERLCSSCLKILPRKFCTYCELDFHQIHSEASPVCGPCKDLLQQHGTPKECHTCGVKAAFDAPNCRSCSTYQKRYGAPVPCESCHKLCAFQKGIESRKKVGGKQLCLLCTRKCKLLQKGDSGSGTGEGEQKKRKVDRAVNSLEYLWKGRAEAAEEECRQLRAQLDALKAERDQLEERLHAALAIARDTSIR